MKVQNSKFKINENFLFNFSGSLKVKLVQINLSVF